MNDVLVARGGFGDDTALMRLGHAAHLAIRTTEGTLDSLPVDLLPASTACVVFAARCPGGIARPSAGTASVSSPHRASRMRDEAPGGLQAVSEAARHLLERNPGVAFVGVLVDADGAGPHVRTAARVTLLNAGVDDVIDTAIDPSELAARVAAVVRRARRGHVEHLPVTRVGRPAVDDARRELVGIGGRMSMTAKEAVVMSELVACEHVVTRGELEAALWTGEWRGTPKAVDMHIAKLRPKVRLATQGTWQIETVRGTGFVLVRVEDDEFDSVG